MAPKAKRKALPAPRPSSDAGQAASAPTPISDNRLLLESDFATSPTCPVTVTENNETRDLLARKVGRDEDEFDEFESIKLAPLPKPTASKRNIHEKMEYIVEDTLWDAAMILCLRFPRDVQHWRFWDILMLMWTVATNLVLQTLAILVIMNNMLGDQWGTETVAKLANWRALSGHSRVNVNVQTDETLVTQLCAGGMWSWQNDQLDALNTYVDGQKIPGWVLTLLGLVIWQLSVQSEYQRIVDQIIAVIWLPTIRCKSDSAARHRCEDDVDEIEILGIHNKSRVFILVVLVIPRFTILLSLLIAGTEFVAETLGLSDIILNALGLTFVLDIDEMLYATFISRRMKSTMTKIAPIQTDGERLEFPGGIPVICIVRYCLFTGFLLGSYFGYLSPFYDDIKSAQGALCLGARDFSWDVTSDRATVTLLEHYGVKGAEPCSNGLLSHVWTNVYGGLAFDNSSTRSSSYSSNEQRASTVLSHAFRAPSNNSPLSKPPTLSAALDSLNATRDIGVNATGCWNHCEDLGKCSATPPKACFYSYDIVNYQCLEPLPAQRCSATPTSCPNHGDGDGNGDGDGDGGQSGGGQEQNEGDDRRLSSKIKPSGSGDAVNRAPARIAQSTSLEEPTAMTTELRDLRREVAELRGLRDEVAELRAAVAWMKPLLAELMPTPLGS